LSRIAITACGGVLFREYNRERYVLLIRRRGFWDIPKGKIEEGESLEMCARREVAEEVGCDLPKIVGSLGSTYHEYEMYDEAIAKTTWWFVMVTQFQEFTPQVEEDIEEVRWVELGEARAMVSFDNLKLVLERFEEWLCRRD
jgi:8-oxo-dGTP pyrophosphatase MutT (NUDIX family)